MMPGTQNKRIVIIDIDEKSLLEQGRWPWGRNKLAQLVDILFDKYMGDAIMSFWGRHSRAQTMPSTPPWA